MPVTNLMSVNLSLRATALAVAAIVFLVPMVAQAGSRPCTGAHCKPVKPVVTKIEKPIYSKGFIKVPDTPGLGVELNEAVIKQHLKAGEMYFAPTTEWDKIDSWDREWS